MNLLFAAVTVLVSLGPPPEAAESIGSLAYIKGGTLVAGGVRLDAKQGRIGVLALYDAKTGRLVRRLVGHTDEVVAVAVSPNGARLASSGWEGTVRLWDLHGERPSSTVQGGDESVAALAFSPDGQTLVTGGSAGVVRLRDVATERIVRSLAGDPEGITSVIFTQGGARLAAGGETGVIHAWEVASGRLVFTSPSGQGAIASMALSPDGRTLASSGDDGTVKLWDAGSGRPLRTLRPPPDPHAQFGPEDRAGDIAFSADGTTLAAVLYTGEVRLWDVKEGRPVRLLHVDDRSILSVAFSSDGEVLATGTNEGIRYWDWRRAVLIKH